jgi:hypothetical protein
MKKKAKISSAKPEVIEVIKKGLLGLGSVDWLDCRDLARKVAEKGGNKELAYHVSELISDLVRLNLIEYQWVWDRGRRINYRSIATQKRLTEAFSPKPKPKEYVPDSPKKKKKKKKKLVCCDAQDLVILKSGRKKCRSCGKKFGKKKKKKEDPK